MVAASSAFDARGGFFYCLFVKGLIFDGRAGLYYTLQRSLAEAIYALLYLEAKLRPAPSNDYAIGASGKS